jgi:predicted amidohydrolase YtcJ
MGLYASSLSCVGLRGAASTAEVAERVRARAARTEAGRWIIGRGYDLNLFTPGDAPHARVLDGATVDHPVFLTSHDVHGCWVSSSALRLAHVERAVQAPPGGIIERDSSGEPTGIMYEGAVRLVEAVLPKRTLEQMKDDLALAQADFLHRGISCVQDLDPDTEEGWRALEDEGKLEMCVATAVPQRELRRAIREGRRSGEGSGRLRLGGVKFFLDGALGSRTAAMLEPYADRPGWSGTLLISPDRLREELRLCRDAGLKPLVHAIGDRAVRVVLDAIVAAGPFPQGLEPRIEHAQTIADSDLDRFAASGAIASMQPNHLWTDIDVAGPALGERSRLLFRCGSLLRRGVKLIFGTDAPVEDPDPMLGVTLASERRRPGRDEPAFHPEEAISRADALAAATSIARSELGF